MVVVVYTGSFAESRETNSDISISQPFALYLNFCTAPAGDSLSIKRPAASYVKVVTPFSGSDVLIKRFSLT
jgi:hypothetical protein